ncbi:hypothetical protein E2C01_021176 [Portunus trituberculatus]|uniref:Uncharacterized protein n=1 Tax=Portunus trituberculatus TaxID=210409 RepID=A0A5B7E5C9_PORTR|nr:hypothetical protein [Portunus trituberculatus]
MRSLAVPTHASSTALEETREGDSTKEASTGVGTRGREQSRKAALRKEAREGDSTRKEAREEAREGGLPWHRFIDTTRMHSVTPTKQGKWTRNQRGYSR